MERDFLSLHDEDYRPGELTPRGLVYWMVGLGMTLWISWAGVLSFFLDRRSTAWTVFPLSEGGAQGLTGLVQNGISVNRREKVWMDISTHITARVLA